jgi:hypothetical protein
VHQHTIPRKTAQCVEANAGLIKYIATVLNREIILCQA